MGDTTLSSERLNMSNNCVEETLLQTQIDSLQWQLKQVREQCAIKLRLDEIIQKEKPPYKNSNCRNVIADKYFPNILPCNNNTNRKFT